MKIHWRYAWTDIQLPDPTQIHCAPDAPTKVVKQYQTMGKCLYMPNSVLLYLCGVASGYTRGLQATKIHKLTFKARHKLLSTRRDLYGNIPKHPLMDSYSHQTCCKASKFIETKEPTADFTDDEVSPSVESWKVGLSGPFILVQYPSLNKHHFW